MRVARTLVCALATLCLAASATAQDAKPTFEGRTITVIIGHSPGGTYDTYARMIGSHIGRFLPGHPQVVVQNMPGANTLRATNHIYSVAPQDGTVIGAVASNVVFEPLLESVGARYDLKAINWLPAPADSTNLLVVSGATPVKNFSDLMTHEIKLGSTTPTAPSSITGALYREILGARIRTVFGYQGLPDSILAMQRGEIDGYATVPLDVLRQRWGADLAAGKLRILAQTGDARHRDLPDVPTMLELAKTDDDRTLIKVGTIGSKMTFAYLMGPGVPKERVADMRQALDALFRDPAFLEEAAQRKVLIEPISAQKIDENVATVYSMSEVLLKRFKAVIAAAGR